LRETELLVQGMCLGESLDSEKQPNTRFRPGALLGEARPVVSSIVARLRSEPFRDVSLMQKRFPLKAPCRPGLRNSDA
jgi:hypothetical protein